MEEVEKSGHMWHHLKLGREHMNDESPEFYRDKNHQEVIKWECLAFMLYLSMVFLRCCEIFL